MATAEAHNSIAWNVYLAVAIVCPTCERKSEFERCRPANHSESLDLGIWTFASCQLCLICYCARQKGACSSFCGCDKKCWVKPASAASALHRIAYYSNLISVHAVQEGLQCKGGREGTLYAYIADAGNLVLVVDIIYFPMHAPCKRQYPQLYHLALLHES